jgi:CRISPR-associated protein Cmr3
MWIIIKPLDVLFFRDGRPFTAGETHRARSIFPPTPLTLQGAIRSAVLAKELPKWGLTFEEYNRGVADDSAHQSKLKQLREELGGANDYGQLRLRGPFLFARLKGEPPTTWFPRPLDVLSERRERVVMPLRPLSALDEDFPEVDWNPPEPPKRKFLTPLMAIAEELEEPKFYFLNAKGLGDYLFEESLGPVDEEKQKSLYFSELRLGIKLKRGQRTVERGMLYTAEVIRLKDGDGFLLRVKCPCFPPKGLLRLGGEARAATYEQVDLEDESFKGFKDIIEGKIKENLLDKVKEEGRFKLYLLTPAIFKGGWFPDFLKPDTMELDPTAYANELSGVNFKLISVAVGKPMHIGGWDVAANEPRQIFKAVPAGSVYYFELMEGNAEEIFSTFHFKPLKSKAPRGGELAKIGFGLTLVGRWSYV